MHRHQFVVSGSNSTPPPLPFCAQYIGRMYSSALAPKRAMPSRASPSQVSAIDHRLELEIDGGLIDPRAMPVEIGRHALKRARAVENRRTEPRRMGARAHDRHIALMPGAFEEGPCLRKADRCCRLRHHCHPRRGSRKGREYPAALSPELLRISLPVHRSVVRRSVYHAVRHRYFRFKF